MSRRAPSDNREVDPRVESWMRRAIAMAVGTHPHPNPRVGAVVLTPQGEEVGAGAHLGPGNDHAEVVALREAGTAAAGATVVSTLEPCSHFGKTPPCTDALIAAGVAKVIVGARDPDDRVAGSGIAKLLDAGIEVLEGVLTADVEAADPGYFHHRRYGRPRFRIKLAATLDGQVAAVDGTSQWITSEQARADAHRLRAESDAVLIGAGTLRADDPALDVRLPDFTGQQPHPVVLAGSQPLPENRRLYEREPLIYTPRWLDGPVPSVVLDGAGRLDLEVVAKDLAKRGILEVLVDGGPTVAAAFVAAGLADYFTFYFGASLGGGVGRPMFDGAFTTILNSFPIEIMDVAKVGPDLRVDCRPAGEVG
ncbi:MAG: bifunctional diaminohydroxyphosphoribosylaminopyrimidine deaminase/5-amino-6-(5-phosphoribosylamino)uracil reductase RibD [Acidimicrobiia bacterium]|nr:bifunctional diaminohydroxyphosphoribosylaminopyrimidine deaminase/5-amino-6-(5-phosphoribosylamino)uracil reductase RibD [Acidimicrobiia bacterium]